jgi:hypothetical protein
MEGDRIDKLVEQVRKLTLQVQSLERTLHRTNNSPIVSADFKAFATGDRIRILNAVKKPAKWNNKREWIENEARYATVTRVQGGRVFFVTDNGTSTWRAPNNLSDATQDE